MSVAERITGATPDPTLASADTAWRRASWAVGLLAGLAVLLLTAPPGLAAGTPSTEAATVDLADTVGPLDLSEVRLAQEDARMVLRVATGARWDAGQLGGGRELCVTLLQGGGLAGARICVAPSPGGAVLELAPVATDGTRGAPRSLAAEVSRPAPNVLEATFLPAAAGLAIGPYAWYAESAWIDAICAEACRDRAPNEGVVGAAVVLLAVPPCFGAAARDPARPCENPALRNSVEPTPDRASVDALPFCDAVERVGLIRACGFGTPADGAARTFALIGDSHAANLKPAVSVLTLANRWRGVSILRSGCPTTLAKPLVAAAGDARDCQRWNREVLAWLAAHPEVDTVVLAAHSGARVAPAAGRSPAAAAIAGYRREIRALLGLGRRIVVVRDWPPATLDQLACVSRALSTGRRAQTVCTRPRATSVRFDPLVAAARAARSRHVRVIDLTPHFCDARRCFAVIGGVLVRHDATHLTRTFATTLGPFLLRALGG